MHGNATFRTICFASLQVGEMMIVVNEAASAWSTSKSD